ncbi:hypothetical protein F5148DRAFT_1153286 [Russula earlei]|uniref:Uncharacterized protein n=1 Tax=Russula earlei TaxID=71964 RepID=A0ACC0TVH0_9AGAM|nr:hypothetical protein F5148DRAFT_1153286 [Russula earlei]
MTGTTSERLSTLYSTQWPASSMFLILSPSSSHHPRAAHAREHVRFFLKTLNSRPSPSETCPETRKWDQRGVRNPAGTQETTVSFSQIRSGIYKEGNKRGTPCIRNIVSYAIEELRDRKDRHMKEIQHLAIGDGELLRMWSRDLQLAVPRSSVVQELATDKPSRLKLLATKRGMMESSRLLYAGACGKEAGLGGMSIDEPVVERGRACTCGDGMCERASGRGDDVKGRVRRAAGIGGVSLVCGVVIMTHLLLLWRRLTGLGSGPSWTFWVMLVAKDGNGAAMLVSREIRTTAAMAAGAETVAEGETKTKTGNGAGATAVRRLNLR